MLPDGHTMHSGPNLKTVPEIDFVDKTYLLLCTRS